MKILYTSVLVLVISMAGLNSSHAANPINLNAAGNLETVKRENPAHFEKIRNILAQVQNQPTDNVSSWMRVNFSAQNVVYTDFSMMSFPPKKNLSFSLDGTPYVAVVTLTNFKAKLVPAE